ncbi:hypothetical protein KKA95_00380, partial [Patescibacteria group bacterium]|nr:hypothetical protein [Patescibacteria group bacterium]
VELVDDVEITNTVTSEDDWEAPNAIVSPRDVADSEGIILGGVDSVGGGWEALPGNSEGVFFPGGWGVQEEGVFSPGGFGMVGMDIEPISGEVPSGFGMWWRGVKETIDLTFTFDSEKKAEKRLKYAEENMQMAAVLADSDSPKAQEKIEKLIGKAQKHMNKIEKTRDKWFDEGSENSQQLVGNIVRHNLNRETIMDMFEEKMPKDRLDGIQWMREEGLESGRRLMNALTNENIPEPVKEYLRNMEGGNIQPNGAASGLPTGKRQIEPEKEDAGYIQIGDIQSETEGTTAPPTEELNWEMAQPETEGATTPHITPVR